MVTSIVVVSCASPICSCHRDGGGTITKNELADLMETLGIEATAAEIDLMIADIDQGESQKKVLPPASRAAADTNLSLFNSLLVL